MTSPGVGPSTAKILVTCIDDAKRFQTGRQVLAYFGLVPRQYQSGQTDRNGSITNRGNPLARTILVECAWASLRYNAWSKFIYDRICGGQKTCKKKAAIALARKIAVLAWAMLRDEKDWDPKTMIDVTQKYGKMGLELKDKLQNMKPKENSDQRKARLRKEANAAKALAAEQSSTTVTQATSKAKPAAKKKQGVAPKPPSKPTQNPKPRRARKPVSQTDAAMRRTRT